MKDRIILFLMLLFCTIQISSLHVEAEEFSGSENWKVEFTQNRKMESNFSSGNFVDVLDYMQPGDSASFQVRIQNSYHETTDWYMSNKILKSLEDGSKTAKSGGYSYVLTYTTAGGQKETLYNSETVGGENYRDGEEGLHEATDALEDYFYLDTLAKGESGWVELFVLLDGETQGNDYQDTLAQLQLDFAVELPEKSSSHKSTSHKVEKTVEHYEKVQDDDIYTEDNSTIIDDDTPKTTIVKTGDDTKLVPLFVLAGVLGIMLIIVAIWAMRLRKQLREE